MHDGIDRWAMIRAGNAVTLAAASATHITFVLNEASQGVAGADYEWHSVMAEYLDDAEISEIVTAARDAGFSATTYDGERAFIAAVTSGEWQQIPFANKYVFNTTGSGVGRARTSLVPAFCDLHGIALCSADGLTAALLESKVNTCRILAALGFPVPATFLWRSGGWDGAAPARGTRVICKPCHECSSIGVDAKAVFAFEDEGAAHIADMARVYRQPILVQEFVGGYEVEVPIFPCPLPTSPAAVGITIAGREHVGDGVIDNRMVVEGDYGFYDFDARNPAIASAMRRTAEDAYGRLGFTGLARCDFRLTEEGRFFITDFNTPPHLTVHSSCHFAFINAGLAHSDLMASLATVGRLGAARQ